MPKYCYSRLAQNESILKLVQKWRFLRKIEISGSIVKKQAILGHFEIGRQWQDGPVKTDLTVNEFQQPDMSYLFEIRPLNWVFYV